MSYNYFGCTSDDIVKYYHGTEVTDYATNSISGQGVIESELAYSEERVLEALPQGFSNVLFNGIPYVYVYDGQNLGLTGVSLSNLVSEEKYNPVGGTYENTSLCGCSSTRCPGNLESLTEETVSTVSVSGGIVSITNYDSNKDYYAKLTFDSNAVIGSLKRLIRDMTACRLGSQLFSRGSEDEWVSVKRACEESEKALDGIKNDHNWMPYEVKKLKFYPGTSPVKVKGGISTIRVGRA